MDKDKASSPRLDAVLTGRGGKRRFDAGHEAIVILDPVADGEWRSLVGEWFEGAEAKMTLAVPSPRVPVGMTPPTLQALVKI